jgi:hypothetical protein
MHMMEYPDFLHSKELLSDDDASDGLGAERIWRSTYW